MCYWIAQRIKSGRQCGWFDSIPGHIRGRQPVSSPAAARSPRLDLLIQCREGAGSEFKAVCLSRLMYRGVRIMGSPWCLPMWLWPRWRKRARWGFGGIKANQGDTG